MAGDGGFEYNDEFFFDPRARDRAAKQFSNIWFALYSKKLSDAFKENDEKTKALKVGFQWSGFGVVGLAVLALSLAAIEPTFIRTAVERGMVHARTSEIVAAVASIAGVLSVLMGFFGMGFSERKVNWLRNRMLCERIRQWRWHYYCAHIHEIRGALGDKAGQEAYATKHDAEFYQFIEKLKANGGQALSAVLSTGQENPDAVWAQPDFKFLFQRGETLSAIESAMNKDVPAAEIIAAYKNVRIGAQKRYASYLVEDTGPFATHPATQKVRLHNWGVGLLFLIFALHILLLFGILVCHVSALVAAALSILAVISALIALGLRAVEDGLRPSEHFGRYKGYLAEVGSIEEVFTEARIETTVRNLMIALEKASYKEMVDFLQAGNRSRYVM
jgi:hypothetical protein